MGLRHSSIDSDILLGQFKILELNLFWHILTIFWLFLNTFWMGTSATFSHSWIHSNIFGNSLQFLRLFLQFFINLWHFLAFSDSFRTFLIRFDVFIFWSFYLVVVFFFSKKVLFLLHIWQGVRKKNGLTHPVGPNIWEGLGKIDTWILLGNSFLKVGKHLEESRYNLGLFRRDKTRDYPEDLKQIADWLFSCLFSFSSLQVLIANLITFRELSWVSKKFKKGSKLVKFRLHGKNEKLKIGKLELVNPWLSANWLFPFNQFFSIQFACNSWRQLQMHKSENKPTILRWFEWSAL